MELRSRRIDSALGPGSRMKRILVATDGSAASGEAESFGIDLATEHDAELIFVHVVPRVEIVPQNGFGTGAALSHEPTAEDWEPLDEAAARAADRDVLPTTMLLWGDPVDEIVAYADSYDVDVIVLGSRGQSALAAMLGTVSRGVLREARRPVAVVGAEAPVAALR